MKMKKVKMMYCKKCRKHTEITVSIAKKKERGSLKKGSIARLEKRGSGKAGFGNKGKFSRKAISAWKRTGAKSSKKQDLRFKCKECGKMMVQNKGFRTKKLELV